MTLNFVNVGEKHTRDFCLVNEAANLGYLAGLNYSAVNLKYKVRLKL